MPYPVYVRRPLTWVHHRRESHTHEREIKTRGPTCGSPRVSVLYDHGLLSPQISEDIWWICHRTPPSSLRIAARQMETACQTCASLCPSSSLCQGVEDHNGFSHIATGGAGYLDVDILLVGRSPRGLPDRTTIKSPDGLNFGPSASGESGGRWPPRGHRDIFRHPRPRGGEEHGTYHVPSISICAVLDAGEIRVRFPFPFPIRDRLLCTLVVVVVSLRHHVACPYNLSLAKRVMDESSPSKAHGALSACLVRYRRPDHNSSREAEGANGRRARARKFARICRKTSPFPGDGRSAELSVLRLPCAPSRGARRVRGAEGAKRRRYFLGDRIRFASS